MTDHLPNCYRNQTMGHYGGGPADCDCGAARRAMVKPASMTDAASKAAREIVNKYLLDVAMPVGKLMHVESAILSAIESAAQAERERASKLVEAAKAVQELQPKVGESPLTALRRHKKSHEQIQVIWDGFDAALAAYEVQP